jgi:hypothetical protein
MSLIHSLLEAVRSWRRRRGGTKPNKRASVALEQLDHRQLLSVGFSGNVAIDFPATTQPGVVVLPNNPSVKHPTIPPTISPMVKVSGLDISGIRLTYQPSDDSLSIGLEQPDNQKTGQTVIAGDTDNNLNSADVAPDVLAVEPSFIDFADLGGSETMGAFLDLNGDGLADIVAGISNSGGTKLYQVADAIVNPMAPNAIPQFGTQLPENTGNVYLVNNPDHGAFEFAINNFSELFKSVTGNALTPQSTFSVGAFGSSNDDDGIDEAFFPLQTLTAGDATPPLPPPPPPCVCPPLEPPIMINPHAHRHINTAHPTDVRVNIFGTAGFDVNQIDPTTVRIGGAAPILHFTNYLNRDKYLDVTYDFRGSDIKLPPGIIDATVTGKLLDGQEFSSTYQVFNRNYSYYSPRKIAAQQARQEQRGEVAQWTPFQTQLVFDTALQEVMARHHGVIDEPLAGFQGPIPSRRQLAAEAGVSTAGGPVVSIPRRQPVATAETVKTVNTHQHDGPVVSIATRGPKTHSKLKVNTGVHGNSAGSGGGSSVGTAY